MPLRRLRSLGPAVFTEGNLTAMSQPYRRRRGKFTEARRQHIIKEKLRLKERWENNREGMLKRSHGGGRATAKLYANRRDYLVGWLETMPLRMTKQDMVREFELRMAGGRQVKARSLIEKMRLYGKIRYDEDTGLWTNLTKA
jgi:hypothetical protein